MRNTFKYTVLYLMRERYILIWALAFPLILSTLFFFMFSGLDTLYYSSNIGLVVVEDDAWHASQAEPVRAAVEAAAEPGTAPDEEQPLLQVLYEPNVQAAKDQMGAEGMVAYMKVDDAGRPQFFMKADASDSSLFSRQTVVKTVVDSSLRVQSAVSGALDSAYTLPAAPGAGESAVLPVASSVAYGELFDSESEVSANESVPVPAPAPADPAPAAAPAAPAPAPAAPALSLTSLSESLLSAAEADTIERVSLTRNEPSEETRYYYALLGMATMFSAAVALVATSRSCANTSEVGARRALGSTSRMRVMLATFAASWVLSFACLAVAFAYMRMILGIDFGGKDALCVVALAVAALAACALGSFIGALPAIPESAKNGILTGIACLSALFAGLYGQACMSLADQIAEFAPWSEVVNPARQISQAFYSLYYYDSYESFVAALAGLVVMSVVFLAATALAVRRQQHEHL